MRIVLLVMQHRDSRRSIQTADESVAIDRQQNRDQQIWQQISQHQSTKRYGICFDRLKPITDREVCLRNMHSCTFA